MVSFSFTRNVRISEQSLDRLTSPDLDTSGPAILIDSTATDTLPSLYSTILGMNVHLVTPNKKGFSSSLELYKKIQNASYPKTGSLVYGESTVGAGLPILSSLKDLVETGDEVSCTSPRVRLGAPFRVKIMLTLCFSMVNRRSSRSRECSLGHCLTSSTNSARWKAAMSSSPRSSRSPRTRDTP